MKDMERYLGATYRNSCQPDIMTDKTTKPPNPYMSTIIPFTGAGRTKKDREITYPEKKNIDRAIYQKLMNKDGYETYMQKVYNIIVVSGKR